jgi:hypothetical protein
VSVPNPTPSVSPFRGRPRGWWTDPEHPQRIKILEQVRDKTLTAHAAGDMLGVSGRSIYNAIDRHLPPRVVPGPVGIDAIRAANQASRVEESAPKADAAVEAVEDADKVIRKQLKDHIPTAIATLVAAMAQDNTRAELRIRAAQILLEHGLGKPAQAIFHAGERPGAMSWEELVEKVRGDGPEKGEK